MIPFAATIRSNRLELHRRLLQILGQLSAADRPLPRLRGYKIEVSDHESAVAAIKASEGKE